MKARKGTAKDLKSESSGKTKAKESKRNDSETGFRVVGIGASAGGLKALKTLLEHIPADSGVCFVVVVHLSPTHESRLADLLQPLSKLPVTQVTVATDIEANHIYVIPPNANIEVEQYRIVLSELEPERQLRAPIDHFFRSLAEVHEDKAVGIVLTGTGSDGTAGLRHIQAHGGLTIAQSPDEAEHDAMPRSAISAGVVDFILPLEQIPDRLLQLNGLKTSVDVERTSSPKDSSAATLNKVLDKVRVETGHDFSNYKHSTVQRRIARRMQLNRTPTIEAYLKVLAAEPKEASLLFEDLLITVTEFFRDPKVFEYLEQSVMPKLFGNKKEAEPIRIWNVGCSSGEEAFSFCMLMQEVNNRLKKPQRQIQIFATDLHEPSLRRAREGFYPATIDSNVSKERLNTFFSKANGGYRIHRKLREQIVFALHNVLQDPPFSHLQLISCRNVLIYLQREVQNELISLFHYALDGDGYLLLGTAEGIDTDLFRCVDKHVGIYQRRSVPNRRLKPSAFPLTSSQGRSNGDEVPSASYGILHEQVVELYAPPSALINPEGELVHYSQRAGKYLNFPGGKPTNNIYRLLAEPLQFELRTAIRSSEERSGEHRSKPIELELGGHKQYLTLRVQPIKEAQMEGFFLLIFDEIDPSVGEIELTNEPAVTASLKELQTELNQAHRQMKSMAEAHEASQERTQAYNEELESTNEELRSAMEELETSKEEMQSMNEELQTINQENLQKAEELDQLSSDLYNLLTATHIATVFLDKNMQIMRFTPSMAELFNMRDSDRGRSLADLTHSLAYDQLHEDFRKVLANLSPVEREVESEKGLWYLVRLQCYRTSNDHIDGVVITFIDITDRKEVENLAAKEKEIAEVTLETVRIPMLVLKNDLCIQSANEAFCTYFGLTPREVKGISLFELQNRQFDIPSLRKLIGEILPESQSVEDYDIEFNRASDDVRHLRLNANQIDHIQLILLAFDDVTDEKQTRQTLEESQSELEQLVVRRTLALRKQAKRLQHLVHELSATEQRERKRMASILHDDLQQLLVAVKIQLEMARSELENPETLEKIDRAISHLDDSIETTHTLVRQTNPKTLYEKGLFPALQSLCGEMSERHGLSVKSVFCEQEPELSDNLKTVLFEGIRELLFNIVKHANVDAASLTIESTTKTLSAHVVDKGQGFDQETISKTKDQSAFGMESVGTRVKALGGTWKLSSQLGKGTNVHITVPVTQVGNQQGTIPAASSRHGPSGGDASGRNVCRIIVVDDHALVRDGITSILNREPNFRIVYNAADGVEALKAVQQHQPDVVLMDINMPHMDGIQATKEILSRWPEIMVIGLTMQDLDSKEARDISAAGAVTVIRKSDDSLRIIETILSLMHSD
ncbi:MAG: PAS domain-containing protein [Opitutales bacterium]|nr:PAS domain-containing protein [Opitutales bacterium]